MSFQGEIRREEKKKVAAPNPPMTMKAATLTLPKILRKAIEVPVGKESPCRWDFIEQSLYDSKRSLFTF